MRVRGLVWVGIDSTKYEEMLRFLRSLGNPRVVFEDANTAEFEFKSSPGRQLLQEA